MVILGYRQFPLPLAHVISLGSASGIKPGPAVIKLFESENELKCKNCLHDFIETLCLFSKIGENCLRHFKISLYRYNYFAKFPLFSRNSYGKILENILKFYDGGPWSRGNGNCLYPS